MMLGRALLLLAADTDVAVITWLLLLKHRALHAYGIEHLRMGRVLHLA